MLKAIVVYVLFCFLKQNSAFVLRPNAEFLHDGPNTYDTNVNGDHIYGKRSEPQIYPESQLVITSNPNDAFQINIPQYEAKFIANGFQTEFHSEFSDVPFSSGSLLDTRQIDGNQQFPQNNVVTATGQQNPDQQVFTTETFELTPEYQKLYENDQLVEQLPNKSQTSPTQGMNQNGPGTGSQTPSSTQQTPLTNNPQLSTQPNPTVQPQTELNIPPQLNQVPNPPYPTPPIQQPQILSQPQYPSPSMQQSQIPSQPQYPSPSIQQPQIQSQPLYPSSSVQTPQYPQYTPPQPPNQFQTQFNPNYGQTQSNPLYPSPQMQPNPTPTQPLVKMNSAGASSSTFASSVNDQPPQISQNAAAYNYNYDPTRPNPVSGNYVAVNGNNPNALDPNQGNYRITQGTFPTQPNNGQFIPQNGQGGYRNQVNPNFPQLQQPINYMNSLAGQQIVDPNILNTLNGQMAQLPLNPMSMVAPFQQFAQMIPRLVQNTIHQGLEMLKIPPHMIDSALYTLNKDLENVTAKDFVQLPAEGGRLVANTIQQILSEFQKGVQSLPLNLPSPMQFMQPMQHMQSPQRMQSMQLMQSPQQLQGMQGMQPIQSPQQLQGMQPMQPMQSPQQMQSLQQQQQQQQQQQLQQQPQALGRRSPEPWMPNFDLSQYYNSIPFGTAQEKISNMKNEIFNKIQTPSFPQISSYLSKPTMPSIPQPSANGEPVVKVFSSSVSESTQSSSKNGAPPEVAHQATGFQYDYDSTKDVDPLQADLVALKSYTPNVDDPSQGEYVAFENSYPKKGSN